MSEPAWNVHEHRDELHVSDYATVFHKERGQLCLCEVHWDVCLYYPINFKSKAIAQKWIERGTIAELQESLSNLAVGFSTKLIEPRN